MSTSQVTSLQLYCWRGTMSTIFFNCKKLKKLFRSLKSKFLFEEGEIGSHWNRAILRRRDSFEALSSLLLQLDLLLRFYLKHEIQAEIRSRWSKEIVHWRIVVERAFLISFELPLDGAKRSGDEAAATTVPFDVPFSISMCLSLDYSIQQKSTFGLDEATKKVRQEQAWTRTTIDESLIWFNWGAYFC